MKISLPMLVILAQVLVGACSSTEPARKAEERPRPVESVQTGPAYLGIMYVEGPMGVRVAQVFPGSPADQAGLEIGDLIVTANGYPVLGTYTLNRRILSLNPGDEVSLEIMKRDGQKVLKKAVLATLPEKYRQQYSDTPGY
jgi:S1-C subfamily serine protease